MNRDEKSSGMLCDYGEHRTATILLLERQIQKIKGGVAPEDIGDEVVLIGQMMRRKT